MSKRVTLDDWALDILVEATRNRHFDLVTDLERIARDIDYYERQAGGEVNPLMPDPEAEADACRQKLRVFKEYQLVKREELARINKLLKQLGEE
jgi:hypothetical protein